MKKFAPLALSIFLTGMVPCRNEPRKDAEARKSEAIEETRQKGMEKHREWSGSTGQDSAAHKRDSIQADTARQ